MPVSRDHSKNLSLAARWVFPVDGPPLERGIITIAGDRVVAVEPHGCRTADLDLGNAAILPGFVNAHTHLDLSGARGKCPPTPDFVGWLRAVIAHRRIQTPEQINIDIGAGITESLAFGTTLLGDIAAAGASQPLLMKAPLCSRVFYEVIGLAQDRANQVLDSANDWILFSPTSERCRSGLSPHAPYSVRNALFADAAQQARFWKVPLAVHLAESQCELDLLQHRRGPFVAFLQELGVWDPEGLAAGPAQVMRLCDQPIPKIFVHCNHLSTSEHVSANSTIVYCPRTHAAFGHPPHPFREFLARGVRVALGTDSLASNPDLSVLAEARFVRERYPDVPGATILRMATLSGAEALGWADETGSLAPGKSADLVVLPLPNEEPADPHSLVLESALPVQAVMWRGNWIRQAGLEIRRRTPP